jgi:hypothetical protein
MRWYGYEVEFSYLFKEEGQQCRCFSNSDIGIKYAALAFNEIVVWNPRLVRDNAPSSWFDAVVSSNANEKDALKKEKEKEKENSFPYSFSSLWEIPFLFEEKEKIDAARTERFPTNISIEGVIFFKSTDRYSFTPKPIIVDSDPITVACVYSLLKKFF